jgi:hypothetical protein
MFNIHSLIFMVFDHNNIIKYNTNLVILQNMSCNSRS